MSKPTPEIPTPSPASAPLQIAVLIGSVRPASNTAKAAAIVENELRSAAPGVVIDRIDPRALPLAIPGLDSQAAVLGPLEQELRTRVQKSHGVVLVTPEYDGSYSAVLKILIEYLGYPSVLAGKTVTLVGVASGRIGAVRALEHLRGVCLGIGAIVLPSAPSIAAVHHCFDAQGRCLDAVVEAELRAAARELCRYAQALG